MRKREEKPINLKDLDIEDNDPRWIKFVDLFHEWWREKFWEDTYFTYENRFDDVHTLSRSFWLVQWLVEKDHIEWKKFWELDTVISKYSDFELSYDTPQEDYTNILLMELAIRDNPLSFILDILK